MFLGYIHSFRALAIFFIVAGHSIDFFLWPENKQGLEKILRIFMSNGSVLFVASFTMRPKVGLLMVFLQAPFGRMYHRIGYVQIV